MFEKAKVREAEEQRLGRLAGFGQEVSRAPRYEVWCRPCAWIAVACTIALLVWIAIAGTGPDFGAVMIESFKLFLLLYCLLHYSRDRFAHDGPMLRVVLSSAGILYKPYGADHFERLAYRHVRRASVVYTDRRRAVPVIRIEYKRPDASARNIEFVPALRYRTNADNENPLCGEIMRRAALANARMRGESIAPTSSGSGDVETSREPGRSVTTGADV